MLANGEFYLKRDHLLLLQLADPFCSLKYKDIFIILLILFHLCQFV
jgi:hypothetical protein